MAILSGGEENKGEYIELTPIDNNPPYYTTWRFSFESKLTNIKFERTQEIVTSPNEIIKFF